MPSNSIIKIEDITKTFVIGEQNVQILKGVSFEVNMGEFVIIFGPSGCGKSTLLHIVLGLEKPSTGKVIFLDEDIYNDTDEDYRSNFRKKHIGMVYQQPNWIKSLNVGENVAFPLMLLGMDKEVALQKAFSLLEKVEMEKWINYIPTELSSGQQQRVALVRSLVNNPEIIIADEPTGNLDFTSGQEMMQLLHDLNAEQKKTIVMVTHDLEYLKFASSAVRMLDGKIVNLYGAEDMDTVLSQLQLKRGVPTSANALDLNKAEDSIHETSGTATKKAPTEAEPNAPTTAEQTVEPKQESVAQPKADTTPLPKESTEPPILDNKESEAKTKKQVRTTTEQPKKTGKKLMRVIGKS